MPTTKAQILPSTSRHFTATAPLSDEGTAQIMPPIAQLAISSISTFR